MSRNGSQSVVRLRRLLPDATFVGCDDMEVRAAGTDSRTAVAGQVFVAVRGDKCNGHTFAEEAVGRGASGLVVEHTMPKLDVPQCVVADSRVAHALICQSLEGNPAAKLKFIGITGTNGKSTTAILVKSILEAAGFKVGLIGTIEQFDGYSSFPAGLTTPGPDVLAKLLRRMVEAGCSHVVMEVSSHALDQRRVAGITFDTAVFTNLTQDHLDYHGTMEEYAAAKHRLFRDLQPAAWAVLNADDSRTNEYAADCRGRVVRFGIDATAEFGVAQVQLSLDGNQFLAIGPETCCEFETHLVGEHNVANCLAAIAVGHCQGLDWETIRAGVEQVAGVPGRMEPVSYGGSPGFHVLVDYAHTPDAVASVLRSVRAVTPGRVLCLFGAGGDRDRTKRPLMAQAAEAVADMIVVTSDNPRTEEPHQIIGEIVAGFRRVHALAIEPDRRKAIELVLSVAEPGDCVLIAGKGHETYQIIGTERLPFDDRLVAAECLAKNYPIGTESTEAGAGTEERHPALPRRLVACGA